MIDSIYFRDPNGYVIELCAKRARPRRGDEPGAQRRAGHAAEMGAGEGALNRVG